MRLTSRSHRYRIALVGALVALLTASLGALGGVPTAATANSSSSPTSTPAATPTSTPTMTPTSTATAPIVTVSVTPSATDVVVGNTIVVQATSNLGIPRYTLTVIDSSTGAVQDQANPIFTPAQPAPISVSSGGVSWTLQAVRAGTVQFAVGVNGETLDPRCNCFIFTNGSARSALVTVRPRPTPTSTPVKQASCSATYTIVSQRSTGFQAKVTIRNTGTRTIIAWTVTITFSSGATQTLRSSNSNGRIAPGRTVSVGLTGSGQPVTPSNITCSAVAG